MAKELEIKKPSFLTEVELKLRPEIKVATLEGMGEPQEYFDPKAEKLIHFLKKKGVQQLSPILGIYYLDRRNVGVKNVIWDVAIQVENNIPVENNVKFKTLTEARVSSVTLTGSYDLIGPALKYMETILQQKQIKWKWPLTEIYLREGDIPITELQYFI